MSGEISPFSAPCGAEVTGVDFSKPVEKGLVKILNRAFVKHSVLVIRNQKLTPQQMVVAVGYFGSIFEQQNKRFSIPECPEIHYISNQESYPDGTRYIPGAGFHTDHSNDIMPPKATVLLAIRLPNKGGDTQFVNMHAAYEGLASETKKRLSDLRAIHVYQSTHSQRKLMDLSKDNPRVVPKSAVHPLVRVHPETGKKSLYINPIRIQSIIGMSEHEGIVLLNDLLEHATQEKFQYRHQWQLNDMVLWDNRCLLHKANGDYDRAQERFLYRVMSVSYTHLTLPTKA